MKMLDEDLGFIWIDGREMYYTKDGGFSWLPFDLPPSEYYTSIRDIQVIGNEAWLLRDDAVFYNPDIDIK